MGTMVNGPYTVTGVEPLQPPPRKRREKQGQTGDVPLQFYLSTTLFRRPSGETPPPSAVCASCPICRRQGFSTVVREYWCASSQVEILSFVVVVRRLRGDVHPHPGSLPLVACWCFPILASWSSPTLLRLCLFEFSAGAALFQFLAIIRQIYCLWSFTPNPHLSTASNQSVPRPLVAGK